MTTWKRKTEGDPGAARFGVGIQSTFEYPDGATQIAVKRETLEALLTAAGFVKEGRELTMRGAELTRVSEDACARIHPNKPGVICGLPRGHNTVMVGSLEFSHFDPEQELAWLET